MKQCFLYLVVLLWTIMAPNLYAQEKTRAPYFIYQSSDDASGFPLLSTKADVTIIGVIAEVKVTQTYFNAGKKPIEANYVFPASTQAALHNMSMVIGDRTIKGVIKEKKAALDAYEQAKKEGKRSSLLEQHRPNVYQMHVANIMPGDTIKTELYYTENISPASGTYEFVYPTVVGPRYVNEKEDNTDDESWNTNPYTEEKIEPLYDFDIQLRLKGGLPVRKVVCNSHPIITNFISKQEVAIRLDPNAKRTGNRDFIFQYQLGGEGVEEGLLVYENDQEKFFMAMVQPPEPDKVRKLPKREYIFIVDVSGSMSGFPLEMSKQVISEIVAGLGKEDLINMVMFETSCVFWNERSVQATKENKEHVLAFLNGSSGRGGTEMGLAIQRAMNIPKPKGFSRTFVLLTDGYIQFEPKLFNYINDHLDQANFFSLGIGKSVNRYLIEGIAHFGRSEPFIITNGQEAKKVADRFKYLIQSPLLTDLQLEFPGMEVYDMVPSKIPDLMAGRPIVVFGKYRGEPASTIELSGYSAKGKFQKTKIVKPDSNYTDNEALAYLWARHRIKTLSDYRTSFNPEESTESEVTQLGLQYHLLTAYTSFLSVEDTPVNSSGKPILVAQPLPMPQGVPNSAIPIPPAPPPPPPEPTVEEVFKVVEEMPVFPGCEGGTENCSQEMLLQSVYKHLEYPAEAKENAIEGTVLVKITIDKAGKIMDYTIVRDIGGKCGEAVIKALKGLEKKNLLWKPGKQRGRPVNVVFYLPIRFKLNQ